MKLSELLGVIREYDQVLVVRAKNGNDTKELYWPDMKGNVLNYYVTCVYSQIMPCCAELETEIVVYAQKDKPW